MMSAPTDVSTCERSRPLLSTLCATITGHALQKLTYRGADRTAHLRVGSRSRLSTES